MEAATELWTGVVNGIAIVYDPTIQTPNSRWGTAVRGAAPTAHCLPQGSWA